MSAHYWIAQHIADVFRNEPRNVGVLVDCGGETAARFFGEVSERQIDGRKLRREFAHPDVYRQWVEFWREELSKGTNDLPARMSGQHYRIIDGGEVTDINSDAVVDIASYLYALLVSEGGLQEALEPAEEFVERGRSLENDIVDALRSAQILADSQELFVPHPVRRGMRIRGETDIEHAPAFVQENGRLYVMEMVDFSTPQKRRRRDHAGWCAYMFRDVARDRPNTDAIALIKATESDLENDDVAYGLALLQNEANIIDWLRDEEREAFLEDRRRIAFAD